MNKRLLALVFFVAIVGSIQSQNGVELEKVKITQALAYGDKNVAISKMYDIIALQGVTSVYKDSLAYLYFNNREYLSCFLVTNDVLERKPANIEILEMNTVSLESIGAKAKAAEGYDKLLSKSNRAYHAYKLAGLYLEINKLEEAYAAIKKANTLAIEENISISFKVNASYNQDVKLKPAIAYLEGIIAVQLKKNTEAIIAFKRAVQLYPEFVLAKTQLSSLEEAAAKE
jgi:tetratricopeptide (TPR) repeat protein